MLHQVPAQPISFASQHTRRESSAPSSSSSSVQLPRTLARPEFIEVSPAAIAAAAPELVSVPLDYVRRRLRAEVPQMMAGLSSLAPSHVPVLSQIPSAAIAVSMMIPVHSLVLAAQCARLPELRTPKHAVSHTLSLPVIPLAVPSPAAFTILRTFMYDHRLDAVLKALFPCHPASSRTSSGHNLQTLTTHTSHIKDLWHDMVALGLFDTELWDTLDLAWDIASAP
ncbi:hypothetical protein BDP27DRAFT_1309890 [Rhodocollybia butyracea]|uniref:Uncharacterized protein n=1 Tax=Rhodocollybia butyracea TaxID=206335 RepID=A0A9P5QBU6_9AGAR|nr:hypothetical protein BDP27DRAFT_1309890 [Rhodocollybia butyracea]